MVENATDIVGVLLQPYTVAVSTHNLQPPSPWWHWGLAIFIAIVSVLSGFNALATGYIYKSNILDMDFGQLDLGPYPENGSSSEQQQWNETNEGNQALDDTRGLMDELRESGIIEMQIIFATIGCLCGLLVAGLLAAKTKYSFHAAGVWVGYSTISAIVLTVKSNSVMSEFYQAQEYYPANMDIIGMIAGIGQVIFCNLMLAATIFFCWMNTRQGLKQVPESGFHNNSVDFVFVTPDIEASTEAILISPEAQAKEQLKK